MISKSNQYFKNLLYHLSNINNIDYSKKNQYWLDEYKRTIANGMIVSNLPCIMPLLYPEFLYNGSGDFIGDLISYNSPNFNIGINNSDDCQFGDIYPDGFCEFNNYRLIRGKCHADHYWPHSLGGPTILENRVLLCRFHNLAKSNSILSDFWDVYPSWLNSYLKRMYDLKS